MKYLVAFLLSVGVATAADFGTAHDVILFGSVEIAAGQTNVHETATRITGIVKENVVYASGSGMTTTTVEAVQGDAVRFVSTITANNANVTSSGGFDYLYYEKVRYTTVNYGTNTVSVIVGTLYEK